MLYFHCLAITFRGHVVRHFFHTPLPPQYIWVFLLLWQTDRCLIEWWMSLYYALIELQVLWLVGTCGWACLIGWMDCIGGFRGGLLVSWMWVAAMHSICLLAHTQTSSNEQPTLHHSSLFAPLIRGNERVHMLLWISSEKQVNIYLWWQNDWSIRIKSISDILMPSDSWHSAIVNAFLYFCPSLCHTELPHSIHPPASSTQADSHMPSSIRIAFNLSHEQGHIQPLTQSERHATSI